MRLDLGRLAVIGLVALTVIAGAAAWYLQVYAYYERLGPEAARDLTLTTPEGEIVPLEVAGFEGIDSTSSPLRYRACFDAARAALDAAQPYEGATPLVGPGWFGCFDAGALTADLASGAAEAYLSAHEIRPAVDRVIAIYPDGRGFAWHQLNENAEESRVIE
ncbi:MAG: DUF6446 family protein [Paracoccus sp. (in: a-proteobacteria)]|nr:DUF6446 family protein [Paracoccus sp. (in: a-proteobacteria)]